MVRSIGMGDSGDRLPTPVQGSGAYPILVQAAEEVASQLERSSDPAAPPMREGLRQIALEMRSWTLASRPDDEARRRVVEQLRIQVDRALAVLHPKP